MTSPSNVTLTAVPGIRVGHVTDTAAITGCTVILCPPNTVAGVDQRGGGPGTRETDLLRPMHSVNTINAVLLAGGSAFGLSAADGVMHWHDEHGIGYQALQWIVPIVPAAILFDLGIGDSRVRPDAAMGYAACEAASEAPVEQGSVGAGTGCTVGKIRGLERATKGGIGSACIWIDDELIVAALMAVNAIGEILDERGNILGGVRAEVPDEGFVEIMPLFRQWARVERPTPPPPDNTVIGVVATNAALTKEQANKVAQMAHNGLARAVRPAHTMHDGDTIFALATGAVSPVNVNVIGAYAAEVTAQAIRNALYHATSLGRVRALQD